jgi:ribonuclease E
VPIPLPPLQAHIPDHEEELTEPGQPFAGIADERTVETAEFSAIEPDASAVDALLEAAPVALESSAPTLVNHGGFGEAEDTEVTGTVGSLLALQAAFGAPEPPSEAAALEAAPDSAELAEPESGEAELAEAVAASEAALSDLLSMTVAPAQEALPEAAPPEAAPPAAAPLEAAPLEAAPLEVRASGDAGVSQDEALSIEALLHETDPASSLATDAVADIAAPDALDAATPSDPLESPEPATSELPVEEAVASEAPLLDPVEPTAPGAGRLTLPSDFVTSVLEEAGVSMGGVAPDADRLPRRRQPKRR